MRILRVAQKVYPDVKGGGPYHVHAMSRDQAAMGHDVTVLTVRREPDQPHVEPRDGYAVVRYDPAAAPLGNDVSPGLARYLARASEFDVVHAHSHLYFATNVAALTRALGDTPLAITNHGLYSQQAPEWLFESYLRTLGRWTFDRADVVFCYTDVDERRVRELGVGSPIEVVPNGIDTSRFTPDGPVHEAIRGEDPTVLFVGRLVEGKRPGAVLSAVEHLTRDDAAVRLVLCGDGPLRGRLEREAPSNVEFVGEVPYDEMPAIYRGADAFVLPSRSEGTPRSIMEALAAGVPVIGTELPQLRAAFDEQVAYVSSGDVAELAGGIQAALATDRTPTLDDRFDWERTVSETTAALGRLVE